MTLVEFLHPLKSSSARSLCLAAMYFHERYESGDPISVDGLRQLLRKARVPKVEKMNLADTLAKSAPYVDTQGKDGNKFLWSLTVSGQEHVRSLLNLPARDVEIENDVVTLENLVQKVGDADVANYLGEALKCLQVNALRATVVFLWSGAVKKIRDEVYSYGAAASATAVAKFDHKAKTISKIDDLVLIKESVLLLAAQELGVYDKNQRTVLEDCLNLRNKCGHPGKYSIGPKKVSSFFEDLVGIVFK